ncbi:radical SAM family heme chaperone HemW [Jhaorihella thermophila]|uniref:Heme chaperone HemW n=1 Tax=Jhaorihella thermophila TaxID=488547 RepID=A0A1H5VPE7_9RHOB|nr:radical SAM family heme chaperone HemW [Jhaorihella thermophila]SEF89179.1 oxygen-independent coproporphyrinogen-3 oxidase [Jhaorihella thermophila]
MAEDWTEGGFGLYIHWPYCAAKCPYCDFNSHVARQIDQAAWTRAYLAEIDRVAGELPGRVLNSIYFGGGTPSLMHPDTVAAVIDAARGRWTFANDIEITLEANPGSVEAGRFAGYRDAGVNRVSMGIQALNDADLRRLGRIHTVAEARAAYDVARTRFDRVSFDLIYARQNQSLANWRAELTEGLAMAADHLSLYQLTIEPGTAFGDRYKRGKLKGLPADELAADMYDLTQELCEARGLPAYEVSNHAVPGMESQHNLIYWRYGDYAGIGPGAHGRVTIREQRFATETQLSPTDWLQAVARGSGESLRTPLTGPEQAEEYLMMGLRITEGIDLRRYAALAGDPLSAEAIAELESLGMIATDGTRLAPTRQGRTVLNAVLAKLLAG